jgi:hypothetical protein
MSCCSYPIYRASGNTTLLLADSKFSIASNQSKARTTPASPYGVTTRKTSVNVFTAVKLILFYEKPVNKAQFRVDLIPTLISWEGD